MRKFIGLSPYFFFLLALLSCQGPAFAAEPYPLPPGERFAQPNDPGVADWINDHCAATDTGKYLCPDAQKERSDPMPDVTLKGHLCTGHGCWPARPSIEGEPRFTVGGIPVHLQGQAWADHCCEDDCHGGVLKTGASRFTVGGRQLGRVGDPVSCGSQVAEGDPRFTVG